MKKIFLSVMMGALFTGLTHAQTAEIDPAAYTVLSVSSQSATDTVQKAFDGDTATWWALGGDTPIPAVLVLDLGQEHSVCGIRYLCNPQNDGDKLKSYALYVGDDTVAWGEAQASGDIFWDSAADVTSKDLLFGAVKGRFVKIVYLDNTNTWNRSIQTAELRVLDNADATDFRKNQLLRTDSLPVSVSSLDTVYLRATASSGLPVKFNVLSGAAKVMERNDSCFLISDGLNEPTATLVLEAVQEGNEEYYPVRHVFGLQMDNPLLYGVQLYTPLVESEIIAMPSDTLTYPLWARAEIGSAFNHITEVNVEVEGVSVKHYWDAVTNTLRADFVPGRYGDFTVSFYAAASNGRDTSFTRTVTVDSVEESRTVRAFEHMLINFPDPGRTNGGVFVFPQHVGSYQRIIAKLDMRCPDIPGGCDDWDRVAWVEMQTPDGQWREIIRYTTAYGVPCRHELDVSDFSSWLQGEVPMRMFIDTWGSGGYDITLDFEFVKGLPQYLYSAVVPLWNGNFPFGDPANLQPMDTLRLETPEGAAALSLKVVTTGHGWGENNTSNAAEFYDAKHILYANETSFLHEPWMRCNPNPDGCTGQRGTWRYSRAGWCPGAIAPGYNYNLAAQLGSRELEMKFIMQEDYMDKCHPNNPDCVSGVTCSDCKDTYNPQYYIASYLIAYYDKMYDSLPDVANEQIAEREELRFSVYPNPASDRFFVQTYGETGRGSLQVFNMKGETLRSTVFNSGEELNARAFDVRDFPAGVYFVRIQTLHRNGIQKIIVR
ncbi:MAG: discoidin domain-containing protein [Bacteroides sp.]|nr:discoidin domain-containing protein [Bacteroides sp.]MCM1086386.1 discoidin domain-containing protein [Bacteroides sp.]